MSDIISIGKILRDILIKTSEFKLYNDEGQKLIAFPFKQKINIDDVHFGVGGGAANTALSFAKLGKKTAVLACIGNDPEGDEILNLLKMRFVETDIIQRIESKTGVSIILNSGELSDKDHTVLIYRGANKNLGKDIKVDVEKLNTARGWYISSLGQEETDFLNLLFAGKGAEVKIAFNPGILQIKKGVEGLSQYLKRTDILILNSQEAKALTGKSYEESFNVLYNAGVKVVIITEGKEGAKVFDGQNLYFGQAYESNAVEALGAGDAFGSTFFAVWLDGGNIEKSLKYALVNSAAALEKYGASEGLLSRQEIEQRLKNKDIEIIKKSLL